MAKTYTKQERDERYERLPQVLKEALFSADIAEKMFALGKKYALTMEKIGFMSEEAGLVVLGLTPPRAFTAVLAERLQIPADAAEKIALEISHEIFFPLREALKQTHQIDVGEGAVMSEELRIKKFTPTPKFGVGAGEARQEKQAEQIPQAVKPPVVPKPLATPPAPASPPPPQVPKPVLPSPTILSSEVKPALTAPVPPKPEAPRIPETPKTEPVKKMPSTLRAVTENLEKEIAPIISTIRNGGPAGFLSREETEKLVVERQAEETGIMNQELGIKSGVDAPIPTSLKPAGSMMPPIPPIEEIKIAPPPSPPSQKNSIDLRASAPPPDPPPPPITPGNPKIPPIDLRAIPIRPPAETKEPPKQTEPAPEKTKPYQGYDPYRESIE